MIKILWVYIQVEFQRTGNIKRLVVRRRPYGPPLTASRCKHCFMLARESKRNLKKLMMELNSQYHKPLIRFYGKINLFFVKKLTLTKQKQFKKSRETNDEISYL